MSNKNIAFYQGNQSIIIDFSAEKISTDGSLVLLEKIERKHKLIKHFSKYIPDNRDKRLIDYPALFMQKRNEMHECTMACRLQCRKPRHRNTPNLGVFKTTEFVGIT